MHILPMHSFAAVCQNSEAAYIRILSLNFVIEKAHVSSLMNVFKICPKRAMHLLINFMLLISCTAYSANKIKKLTRAEPYLLSCVSLYSAVCRIADLASVAEVVDGGKVVTSKLSNAVLEWALQWSANNSRFTSAARYFQCGNAASVSWYATHCVETHRVLALFLLSLLMRLFPRK